MTTVLISGLGLIGSSLARMIRKSKPDATVLGSDPDSDTSQFMLDHQLMHHRIDFETGAVQADVIILAGPVSVITTQLATLARLNLKTGVLVTDVGSTKAAVLAAAQPLMDRHVAFLGGHPMAGSHKTGSAAGAIQLFMHASYFLVPGTATEAQLDILKGLLAPAQFHYIELSADRHDQLVSTTSHLPHVVAATLMNTAQQQLAGEPNWHAGTAGGFRDTTRISAADPTMWTAIMTSNREAILGELTAFEAQLVTLRQAIESGDQAAIHAFFDQAQRARQTLN